MTFLVDANALIWALTDPKSLSRAAQRAMIDVQNELLVSIATLWELALKLGKGNLPSLGSSIQVMLAELREQQIGILPIRAEHLIAMEGLPPFHRDPFDRMLLAQAVEEDFPIISSDRIFARYPVKVVW